MSMHWTSLTTEGRIEAIKSVYEPGMSAREIADAIGGISRNAVVGMYMRHRGDLQDCALRPFRTCGRSKKGVTRSRRKVSLSDLAKRFGKPEPVEVADVPEAHLCGRPISMLQHAQCRWPVNDAAKGETHLFCGMPSEGAFCAHHEPRAYRSAE